jgi:hypothetical protein
MHPALYPVTLQFQAATEQFRMAVRGMSMDQGLTRINGVTNHAAYLGLHLVDARCFVVRLLGGTCAHGFEALTEGARGPEDIETYPTLQEIGSAWDRVSDVLMAHLRDADSEALDEAPPFRFPVDDETVLGAVTFLAHHEAYHLGQLGLIRKALGMPPIPFRSG